MVSTKCMVRWGKGALTAALLTLLAFSASPRVQAEEIDWNRAKDTWVKSLRGEQLTPEEKTALAQAQAALGKQGIDVKRIEAIGKKALGGETLSADDQTYLERAKEAVEKQ